MNDTSREAEAISLFCRININTKRNLPVRSSEMGLLIFLVKSETDVTPVKAAEFLKVTKPRVTSMVNSLQKKGFLNKLPSDTDKRSISLIPTEKAVQLVDNTYEEYCKNLNMLRDGMGKEDFEKLVWLIGKANTILLEGR